MKVIRDYIRQNLALVAISILVLYFFMAAVQGQMGFFRLLQVRAQISEAEETLEALQIERAQLQNLTHRLSNNYLDLDLLDEQARKRLGLVRSDEIIIQ